MIQFLIERATLAPIDQVTIHGQKTRRNRHNPSLYGMSCNARAKTHVHKEHDIGTAEGSQSIADVKLLRDTLLAKGWKQDADLRYFEAKGAEHLEKNFAQRAPEVLKYLFPGSKAAAQDFSGPTNLLFAIGNH